MECIGHRGGVHTADAVNDCKYYCELLVMMQGSQETTIQQAADQTHITRRLEPRLQ